MNAQALAELNNLRPMAIDPPAWSAIARTAAASSRAESRSRPTISKFGKQIVGILPLCGMVGYRSALVDWLGGCNLDSWLADLRYLDGAVDSIMIDCCSGGGFVDFVPEAAAAVRDCKKPTVAMLNPMAASAAYWIVSGCDAILATRSGEGGSIGVRTGHVSFAGANEKFGVEVTLVASSPEKIEFSSDLRLSPEALARLQESVNDIYADFKADVLKGRGVAARPEYARLMSSREMAAAKLIDGVVADPGAGVAFAGQLGALTASRRQAFARCLDLARYDGTPAADVAAAALSRTLGDGSYRESWQRQADARERELQWLSR